LNAAKISLFLNSLYLAAIFSAIGKKNTKTGFCFLPKPPISQSDFHWNLL